MLNYKVHYTYSAPTAAHPEAIVKGAQEVALTRFECENREETASKLLASKIASANEPDFKIISVKEL